MCQGLPLGCLHLLEWFVRCRTETLAVVQDLTFLTGTSIGSDSFCNVFQYNFFIFPNFGRIFGVQEVWWMFRLLQTVLFLTDSVFDA